MSRHPSSRAERRAEAWRDQRRRMLRNAQRYQVREARKRLSTPPFFVGLADALREALAAA